jgi:pimeloyl-ACP methyl ester carboxylesterase
VASETFFFRESKSPLFAQYHAPDGSGGVRPTCVLLCQPYGHEYIRGHRAFRTLAERLARAGFPTLRFDYRGCGDSGMDAEEVGLDEWTEDLRAAAEMCRARSGRRKVTAFGLRLGASLALLESGAKGTFDGLVLWDPILSGRDYLKELVDLHESFLRSLPGGGPGAMQSHVREYIGFPYAAPLHGQLERLDLTTARVNGVKNVLTIETAAAGEPGAGLDLGAERQDRRVVDDVRIWMEDADKALIPQESLAQMVEWLKQVYP